MADMSRRSILTMRFCGRCLSTLSKISIAAVHECGIGTKGQPCAPALDNQLSLNLRNKILYVIEKALFESTHAVNRVAAIAVLHDFRVRVCRC